jgi:hypothetical protein
MTLKSILVLQSIAACLQVIVPSVPGLSDEWAKFAHVALGAIQVLLTRVAGLHNPDGTPASVAYEAEDVTGKQAGERSER